MGQAAFCYRVGEYRIMLEEGIRSELLSVDKLYPVPFAPNWCAGLASVRGDLFPVIDMHVVLLHKQRPSRQYLLWLQHPAFAPALISCDELPRQTTIPSANERAERPPGLPGWIKSVWEQDGSWLLAADHVRLFNIISKSRQLT